MPAVKGFPLCRVGKCGMQPLTEILYNTHDVAMVWNIMAVVGLISAFGIYMYGRWILTLRKS